jgi:hypothetical protein
MPVKLPAVVAGLPSRASTQGAGSKNENVRATLSGHPWRSEVTAVLGHIANEWVSSPRSVVYPCQKWAIGDEAHRSPDCLSFGRTREISGVKPTS